MRLQYCPSEPWRPILQRFPARGREFSGSISGRVLGKAKGKRPSSVQPSARRRDLAGEDLGGYHGSRAAPADAAARNPCLLILAEKGLPPYDCRI